MNREIMRVMALGNLLGVVRKENLFDGQYPDKKTKAYKGSQLHFDLYEIKKREGSRPTDVTNLGKVCRVNICYNGKSPASTRFNHLTAGDVIHGFSFISQWRINRLNCAEDSLIISPFSVFEEMTTTGLKGL